MAKTSLKNINKLIRDSVKNSSTEAKFLMDLENFIQTSEEVREKSRTYKPSSMQCIRNMYYQLMGKEQDDTIRKSNLIGINECGTDRHERLQKHIIKFCENNKEYEWVDIEEYIKEKGLKRLEVTGKYGAEVKIFHKLYNLSFMCDGILKINGKYYLLEIKTETSFKFTKRKEVDGAHINQASCYSLAFGINNVLFVYECRDNCAKKSFMKLITPKMRQDVVDKISECDNYINILKTPPKEEDEKVCQYCTYTKQCRHDGD